MGVVIEQQSLADERALVHGGHVARGAVRSADDFDGAGEQGCRPSGAGWIPGTATRPVHRCAPRPGQKRRPCRRHRCRWRGAACSMRVRSMCMAVLHRSVRGGQNGRSPQASRQTRPGQGQRRRGAGTGRVTACLAAVSFVQWPRFGSPPVSIPPGGSTLRTRAMAAEEITVRIGRDDETALAAFAEALPGCSPPAMCSACSDHWVLARPP